MQHQDHTIQDKIVLIFKNQGTYLFTRVTMVFSRAVHMLRTFLKVLRGKNHDLFFSDTTLRVAF